MIRGRPIKLSVGSTPPSEFRLFTKGWNETENGRFLFDDAAARAVMAAYQSWGVDLAIDLEHQMLEVEAGDSPDPTARDARGWCRLELRNGELWAAGVTWTPDGARRLTEKRQRYVSPAFEVDPKTKRILKIINVAIVGMPATHNTPALVAAARKPNMASFDPSKPPSPHDAQKLIAELAELLGVDDPEHADHDTIDKALGALFAAVTGAQSTDAPPDASSAQSPRQIDANAVRLGRQIMPRDMAGVRRLFGRH